MRRIVTLGMAALAGLLVAGSAVAAEHATGWAVLVSPNTHQYVGTFVQDCSKAGHPYVGAYLNTPVQLQANQSLSLAVGTSNIFTSSPRALGEEATVSEVGGASRTSCLANGTKVTLYMWSGNGPLTMVGSGAIAISNLGPNPK